MIYQIKINGESVAPEDLCASSAVLTLKSLACDELKIHSKNSELADFADNIDVLKNGVRIFQGTCFSKTNSESAKNSETIYVFKNAWNDLMEIPFMQDWNSFDLQSQNTQSSQNYKTKILLGVNQNGQKISLSAQIQEILNYAIQKGARLSYDLGSFTTQIPTDEMRDMSCDEALKRILRWSPDAVSYFDYSQNTPILYIKKRSELPAQNISNYKFKTLSYTQRNDLKIDNACVIYEKHNTQDGTMYEALVRDVYPQNAVAGGKKSLVISVQLGGYSNHIQRQKIESEAIYVQNKSWWKQHVPFLNTLADANFTIKNTNRISSLPRELKSGTVMEWMLKNLEEDVVSSEIEYETPNGERGVKTFSVKLLATDASNQTYSRTVFTSLEEQVPTGLARAIYEASSCVISQGSAQLVCDTPSNLIGKNLKIPNKFENAVITNFSLNLANGFSSFSFGAPSHLYPPDLAQLFRVNRSRKVSTSNARVEAKSASLEIDSPNTKNQAIPTESKNLLDSLTIGHSLDGATRRVVIDVDDINEGSQDVELKLRKVAVVENGIAKSAYILMSNTF